MVYGTRLLAKHAESTIDRDEDDFNKRCSYHPKGTSKHSKRKTQFSEVKGVMMENIERIIDCGEKVKHSGKSTISSG